MPHTSDHTCECEHESHFTGLDEESNELPPASHAYGAAEQATVVRTIYGTFKVCQQCADEHFPQEYRR